jgi:hypothetical protein
MITERPAGDREKNQVLLKRLAGVLRNYSNRSITPREALGDIEQIVRETMAAMRAEEEAKQCDRKSP